MRTFALTLASLALAAALPVPGDQAKQDGPMDMLSAPLGILGGGSHDDSSSIPQYQQENTQSGYPHGSASLASPESSSGDNSNPITSLMGSGGPLNMLGGGGENHQAQSYSTQSNSGSGSGGNPLDMVSGLTKALPLGGGGGSGSGGSPLDITKSLPLVGGGGGGGLPIPGLKE